MLVNLKSYFGVFFWKSCFEHTLLVKIYHKKKKPFENEILLFEDDIVNNSFQNDNKKWYHNEFIYLLLGKSLIEPSNMICIKGFRTIILETITGQNERPSLWKYLVYRIFKNRPQKYKKAILFDGSLGRNYFHFFSDIINKIWLLDKFNFDKNIPFIIPKKNFEKTYFQYLYQNTELKDRVWIVQDNQTWIETESLFILKAMPYDKVYWQKTVSLVNIDRKKGFKRIFLTRSKQAGRFLKNFDKIVPVLNKYDITVIDTEKMSFQEQINTFAGAEFIIGIHGAGNTNIVFSDWEKLTFIELIPSNRIACHYYWLSSILGIKYDVVKGSALDEANAFEVCLDKLERTVNKYLN